MSKAVELPNGIGIEADDKSVRFELEAREAMHEGIGRLAIWKSPTEAGKFLVQIHVPENLGPPERPAFRFTTIEISAQNALLLRKCGPESPHEYEISSNGSPLPPWPSGLA